MDAKRCACDVQPIRPKTVPSRRASAVLGLLVEGMGCPNCAMRVRNALVSVEGVEAAHVSLMPPLGTVRYDPERVTEERLLAAVAGAGADTPHEYSAWPIPQRLAPERSP